MKNTNLKIAITGGIGSGKSTVLSFLKEFGCSVVSSDQIVTKLYQKPSVKRLLKSIFPDAVSGKTRLVIDRKIIAEQAFFDKQKHRALTDAITPLVLKEIVDMAGKNNGLFFAEVPLLFECGYQAFFDKVIVITREKSERISAVKARSNLTEEQIQARINAQIDYQALDLSKHLVLENSGDQNDLKQKVKSLLEQLKTAPLPKWKNDKVYSYIQSNFSRTVQSGGKEMKPLISPCANKDFTCFFYWDTYFANLALFELGDFKQVKNNLDNMCYLLDKYGYIPNAYQPDSPEQGLDNRSQPPLFSFAVNDYYRLTGDRKTVKDYLPFMEKEYSFWMSERITPCGLNKYGHSATKEYLTQFCLGVCSRLNLSPDEYSDKVKQGGHFLAIAESGWDFTPRFNKDSNLYACEDFAPVDLNAMLYGVETILADFCRAIGKNEKAEKYLSRASKRKTLMDTLMKSNDGLYYDYDYTINSRSTVLSAASFTPYAFGVSCDKNGLKKLTERISYKFGISATEKQPSECLDQWAFPSIWPPLTFFAIKAMERLDRTLLITQAEKYVSTVQTTFKKTDTLWEKYDCKKGGVAVGHEYGTVEMFGWTAGVYAYLIKNVL